MQNAKYPASINKTALWIILLAGLLIYLFGLWGNMQGWSFAGNLTLGGAGVFAAGWVILLVDMFRQPLYNKSFWILSMFILAPITPIVYLVRRDRFIRAGRNTR